MKPAPLTNVTNASRPAVSAAYVAAALFVVAFVRFFVLPPEGRGNVLVALLGVAPFDPTHFVGLLPSFVLLPVCLVLVGRLLHREDELSAEGGEPAPLASIRARFEGGDQ